MSLVTSILTGGTNNHPTTSEEANYFATDFISDGVVGAVSNTSNLAPATGSFAPNAQDTPDMTISIASGALYVTATPSGQNSQVLRVTNSASANVTISANSSGSTKYDWVYLKIDATTANEPNLAGDDVASLVTSRSTSNTTDDGTPPTYGYCLAVVTVANGATSITDSNIRDKRVQSQVQDQTSSTGWVDLGNTLEYTSNDGNKQATYTVSGTDITDTIQEGMKVKLPRTTTVGTQCTDLEASSSQYASKTSPSGITFTDDFTVGAWVKLESVGSFQTILSRYNGTSGWLFALNTDGTIHLSGRNGSSSNYSRVTSYQSMPLNKWVHISAQLDMSSFTSTTTTSYIMINGVVVTSYVERGGTNPTALVQAGNLELGSYNSGTSPFDGKIKHAFVTDSKITNAQVQEAMVSDDLTSASFSANLDAYFKLEGDFTDSSANGNDLTASGGAVATNADSPFSSTEYGIITSATFSTDTTVTVFTGDGVAPNEDITAPSYSTHRVPYGFPAGKDKWKIQVICKSEIAGIGIGALNQWFVSYSVSLRVMVGSWNIVHIGTYTQRSSTGGIRSAGFTLADSTALPATNGDYSHPLSSLIFDSYSTTASLMTVNLSTDIYTPSMTDFSPRCSIKTSAGGETWEIRGTNGPVVYTAYCNYL